jgi:hypothetical protein
VHQVCRKCRQCCPHLNKIVHIFMSTGTLFTYTVYHCSLSVDNIHTFKAELQYHVTHFYLKYCSCHHRKCGQCCPHFAQIVHTFWRRVHRSHKTLFTYLTESVDKIIHTFIKLSTLSGEEFIVHIKYYLHI